MVGCASVQSGPTPSYQLVADPNPVTVSPVSEAEPHSISLPTGLFSYEADMKKTPAQTRARTLLEDLVDDFLTNHGDGEGA